ncbi:MAG: HNH endonuclease [Tepidisphaerales bacterium]
MSRPTELLSRLAHLRVDRKRDNVAPHKPALLLALLDLIDRSELPAGHAGGGGLEVALTPELAFTFATFGGVAMHRRSQKLRPEMPFYHLHSDGLWTPLTADGREATSRADVARARLATDFAAALADPAFRQAARRVLIETYFEPSERTSLYELVGLDRSQTTPPPPSLSGERLAAAVRRGRDARFRLRVVTAYGYRCALTGYRLNTLSAGTLVDAAHIRPVAADGACDPTNGLALSKNAHWMFDEGLWTLTDDYHVQVAHRRFVESNPDGRGLADYHGRALLLPDDRALWPRPEYLAWHRRHRFLG